MGFGLKVLYTLLTKYLRGAWRAWYGLSSGFVDLVSHTVPVKAYFWSRIS